MLPAPIARIGVLLLVIATGLALAAGSAFASISSTDDPAFCDSCHEMQPYHDAWSAGPHAGVSCVECHVADGLVERMRHKIVALGQVKEHVFGEPLFPLAKTPEVPDDRCVACHADVGSASDGFSHERHAATGECIACHARTGHAVATETLAAAGVWSGREPPESRESTIAAVDAGAADLEDHPSVPCQRCHVMSASPCSGCHEARHAGEREGECVTCHAIKTGWEFLHPADPGCVSCHEAPDPPHDERGQVCTACHPKPASFEYVHADAGTCASCHERPDGHRSGTCNVCHTTSAKWAFAHPSSTNCASCHARPAGHRSGSCANCHSVSAGWSFRHPSGGNCASCHARPSGHRSGACSSCHSGRSWAFKHPSGGDCASCHARPSGHRSGACSSCHSGRGWAFRHPSSRSCASCHKAPSGHYGSTCASCHSPGRSWGSATFRHPSIRGGEHSYRSFSCSKCHPSGYGSASCTGCHGSGGPDDDDDDD